MSIVCLLSIFSYQNITYGSSTVIHTEKDELESAKRKTVDQAIVDYNDIHEALDSLIDDYIDNKDAIEQGKAQAVITVTGGVVITVIVNYFSLGEEVANAPAVLAGYLTGEEIATQIIFTWSREKILSSINFNEWMLDKAQKRIDRSYSEYEFGLKLCL